MTQLKPFSLKLLYFAVGILPVIVMAIISQQDLESNQANFLWFGLFGALIIAAILVQRKLRSMGVFNLKEVSTYIALLIVGAIAFILIRQIV